MISVAEAAKRLKKEYPERTITEAAIYKKEYYLFIALVDPDKRDPSDPFYLVNMKTGKVSNFSPTMNIEAFSDAYLNHHIGVPKL